MKKNIFLSCIILSIFFFSGKCFSQENKIDSLLKLLPSAKEDTNKVNLLNDLGKQYRLIGNSDSSKKHSDVALRLSEKLNFRKGKAFAYSCLGLICRTHGDFAQALKDLNTALKIWEELGSKQHIAGSYINIGLVYWNQGNYPEALKYYFSGLKIDEELNNPADIAIDYNNIAAIYTEQGKYEEALKFFFLAIAIFEKLHDDYSLATLYNNIGNIYIYQNNYAEGFKNLLSSLDRFEKSGNKQGMAMIYNNLGTVYDKKGNYSEALNSHIRCLKVAEETGEKRVIAGSLCNIGSTYVSLKNFSEARKYLDRGFAISKEIGAKDLIKEAYKSLIKLDTSVNNYKQAFNHYELYRIYSDSLFNETSSKQTAEMQTKYESEKKEKEIALLTKDKEIQNIEIKKQKTLKYALIGGLAALSILSLVVFNNFRVRNKLKLQTLRNKIASDLHDDVGSTLSSIAIFSEVAQQQTKEVIPMLDTISESARKMLDAMADIVWTINPENDNFEKIILRMRSFAYELLGAKKIEFEFVAEDDITKKKLPMDVRKNLYLIFKEATNNMVKYSGANKANFSIKGDKDNLTMLIRDNGKGFDMTKEFVGNGLKNMKKRAEEIGAKLLVESTPDKGTTIQLMINV
jgi:signal transduction histidine kinase